MARLAFGFMTGTSCDGVDGAAVRVEGAGLEMRCEVVGHVSLELGAMGELVRQFALGDRLSADEVAWLGWHLAQFHAECVRQLREAVGAPDLVAVHGQTVHHEPPVSWQLVNPWPIAQYADCPVVTDLRGADLAAGGQGAPITPIADWLLFRDRREGAGGRQTRVVVNLGGFCNITLLPGRSPPTGGQGGATLRARPLPGVAQIQARDVCACNHVLDAAARAALGKPFDNDGAAAARGAVDPQMVDAIESLLRAQARSERSLGSADELVFDVEEMLNPAAGVQGRQDAIPPHSARGDDALASATAAVAGVIAAEINALSPAPDAILVAGGSVRNRALMALLAARCRAPVVSTAEFGVDPQYREAAAMAIVGCLAQDGAPVALPHVTGARKPILWTGSWTNLPPARTG